MLPELFDGSEQREEQLVSFFEVMSGQSTKGLDSKIEMSMELITTLLLTTFGIDLPCKQID